MAEITWTQFNPDCPDSAEVLDDDGCHFDDLDSLVQYHAFGFCGCGEPEIVNDLLVGSLDAITSYWQDEEALTAGTYAGPTISHCGSAMVAKDNLDRITDLVAANPKAAAHLILYVLDKRDLTEHGGSVCGSWLSDRGRQVLALMGGEGATA